MAELNLPHYCNDDLASVSDRDMIDILKHIINDVMIENQIYYDDHDRSVAVKMIYPVISIIVFNPYFRHIRDDKRCLLDLITYLVTNLA